MPGLEPGSQWQPVLSKTPLIAGIIKLVLGPAKPDPGARR